MNITCKNCGHVHEVPDESVHNKKIYFYCSNCSRKIVYDDRQGGSIVDPELFGNKVSFLDIFSGLFSFFSWTSLLVTALYGLALLLMTGLAVKVYVNNIVFFTEYPGIGIFLVLVLALIFIFGRQMVLYHASKITFFKFLNPESKIIRWKEVHFDFGEDWLIIFVYSCVIIAGMFIVGMPIPLLKGGGVFYSALLSPLFLFAALFVVLFLFLGRFLPSMVATESKFLRDGLGSLLNFIKTEFVEIPFYAVVIAVISKFFIIIFSLIYGSLMALVGCFLMLMYSQEALLHVVNLVYRFFGASYTATLAFGADTMVVPSYITFGASIILAVVIISFLLFWSFCDNFVQSLYVKAVHLMRLNPRSSFDPRAMLIIVVLLALFAMLGVIAFLMVARFLSV